MNLSIDEKNLNRVLGNLESSNKVSMALRPGESENRQPVHTVYGGAHLFKSTTAQKIGDLARKSFDQYGKDAWSFKNALGMNCSDEIAKKVFDRVADKLKNEPLEDFRIDFEDGFGSRPDQEEDETAVNAANEVFKGMQENSLCPFIGIRIKTFSEEMKRRGIRTLDIFITTLSKLSGGKLPENFVVTLPKVTSKDQVTALIDLFEVLEEKTELAPGSLKMEFMVELPDSLMAPNGECAIPSFVEAARGRCVAAHFGTYDYTASVNITAEYQAMDHSACDFARSIMKVALSGTGIWISDGATNVMPVGDDHSVHQAWKLSYEHIRHSLYNAYYQGWDLHPAQLPVRYAALYSFFLEGLESASARLKSFMETAAKATLTGEVFDDAATGQGLLNYFLRALNCGAISMNEVEATGLTLEEIQTRSFAKILKMRSARA